MIAALRNRRPWAAVAVALVFGPLIGMLYLGKGKWAFAYAVLLIGAFTIPSMASLQGYFHFYPITVSILCIIVVRPIGMVHCFKTARRYQTGRSVVWFARWHWITCLVVLLPFAGSIVFSTLLWQPHTIQSGSMFPTYVDEDIVLVNKWIYGWSRYSLPIDPPWFEGRLLAQAPERGDVVLYNVPGWVEEEKIGRVIGMPGESIQLRDRQLYINDMIIQRSEEKRLPKPPWVFAYMGEPISRYFTEYLPNGVSYVVRDHQRLRRRGNESFDIPEGHFFVVGDDRTLIDFHIVSFEELIGKVSSFYWMPENGWWFRSKLRPW